jgi:hypothetical protein
VPRFSLLRFLSSLPLELRVASEIFAIPDTQLSEPLAAPASVTLQRRFGMLSSRTRQHSTATRRFELAFGPLQKTGSRAPQRSLASSRTRFRLTCSLCPCAGRTYPRRLRSCPGDTQAVALLPTVTPLAISGTAGGELFQLERGFLTIPGVERLWTAIGRRDSVHQR